MDRFLLSYVIRKNTDGVHMDRSLPNQAKRMQRARRKSRVDEYNKRAKRLLDDLAREFKRETGQPLAKLHRGPAFALSAFPGSSKVPVELLQLLLAGEGVDPSLTVTARHSVLLPKALAAIGAVGEELSTAVWHKPLEGYQVRPMHDLLRAHGYNPTTKDDRLSRMLKLIRAGRDTKATPSIDNGPSPVRFSDKRTVRFEGKQYRVFWRGNSPRVSVDGSKVLLWELLGAHAGTKAQRAALITVSDAAQAEVYRKSVGAQEKANMEAQLDAIDFGPED